LQWISNEVLPSINKTGAYNVTNLRSLDGEQMCLLNENDLHFKVVEYIREYHPSSLIIPGLGGFQTTPEVRIEGWRKGYTAGQPDIIITNPSTGYNGFAIELKTPRGTGVVSFKEHCVLNKFESIGYKTLVLPSTSEYFREYFRENKPIEAVKPKRKHTAINRKPTGTAKLIRPLFNQWKY
jgi:hypothetical protein